MTTTAQTGNKTLVPLLLIGLLFFIFGFITWLNGTLIPYLKIACQLNNMESMLVAFAFYISYFVMALPASVILKKTGFKNGMALGLIVMAVGALVFIPAAQTRIYALFLTGLFIQGTGLSILQTASNPYVIILGPIESAAQRISFMGIANKVAGIISPLVLASVVLKGTDKLEADLLTANAEAKIQILNQLAERVINPYIIMAIALVLLAIFIRYSALPSVETQTDDTNKSGNIRTSIFQFSYLWIGVVTLFLYVGVEVLAGDTIIGYGKYWGIGIDKAKFFTSFTLAAMVLGYIIGIVAIPKFISQANALKVFAVLGTLFSLMAIFTQGFTSVLFIAALGFANSIMWPAIFPMAIDGLGKFTKTGSALLIMGIAGGALLPLLYGYLADLSSNQTAYWILVPCYLFILFFAVKGHTMGKRN